MSITDESAGGIVQARPRVSGKLFYAGAVLAVAFVLLYIVWTYESALRDGNFFDGWLLAIAIGMQIWFHARRKVVSTSAGSNKRWMSIHIFNGYVILALLLSHTNFGLPDSLYEWAMWLCLVLISLSGIFGTYLKWGAQAKLRGQDEISPERAQKRRKEIAIAVQNLARKDDDTLQLPLPATPYQAWLEDFYVATLRPFFERPQTWRLFGSSKRPRSPVDSQPSALNTPAVVSGSL